MVLSLGLDEEVEEVHKEAFAPVDIGSNLVAGIVGADYYLHTAH